ncbi:MAG: hypothetical protein ACT4NV_03885 [Rhodoferax sp.]
MTKTFASSIVIALASLAAGQAMAANIEPTTGVDSDALRVAMSTPSTVTRDQLKSDLLAHRAAHKGDVVDSITGVNWADLRKQMGQTAGKSREQVREEVVQARRTPVARAYWEGIVL